ncbi:MAG: hypothetical protein R8F63_00385 [Acidimicrobiales bacterium]|nr:hypothetical protein [Acidimicrobiales bacterium]
MADAETSEAKARAVIAEADEKNLVLDELDEKLAAFNAFRKSDGAAADMILGELGASDAVDRDIILQLAGKRPLGHPEKFDAAHAGAIRSLEVLDRNGARGVRTKLPGPLNAVGAYLIQLVTRFIVSNHQKSLAQNLRKLYARREANCLPDDPARHQLRRARMHADLVGEGFKKNPLGVPSFLLGGAVLSSIVGSVVNGFRTASGNRTGWLIIAAALLVLSTIASWVILRGAAVARRRIVLTTEKPFRALYETIGRCGNPPGDSARQFALISVIVLVAGWALVPIIVGLGAVLVD